jgi:S-disulfanyl-L-cysteine oxidoreductase SoxD
MPTPIRASRWLAASALAAIVPLSATHLATRASSAQAGARTVWDSVYSVSQAATGEVAYAKTCARCHGAALTGGDESPPLTGSAFLGNWNGLPLSDLQTRIRTTMPTDSVGIYERQLITDVMAFLLKANGFPAGSVDLPKDVEPLKDITIQSSRP